MAKLNRSYPFGNHVHARSITFQNVEIIEERGIGFFRVLGHRFPSDMPEGLSTGLDLSAQPQPNQIVHGLVSVAAVSRKERLLIGDETKLEQAAELFKEHLDTSLLIVNATHQLASLNLSGPLARDVLAATTPLPFSKQSLRENQCCRTRFGETVVFVQRLEGASKFRLVFDQSMSEYAWRYLGDAATLEDAMAGS